MTLDDDDIATITKMIRSALAQAPHPQTEWQLGYTTTSVAAGAVGTVQTDEGGSFTATNRTSSTVAAGARVEIRILPKGGVTIERVV